MKKLAIITVALLAISGQLSAQQKEKLNKKNMENTTPQKISDFPVGEENAAYAQYFTGKSWNAP
jgi:murein endopeptidase